MPNALSQKKSPNIAIVISWVHADISTEMLKEAQGVLAAEGLASERVISVPGSYETPLAAQELLEDPSIDGVVVLGAIERGETLDGEVMGHVVNGALVNLSLQYKKPVGIGIIGPGAVPKQMHERKIKKAVDAVRAVLSVLGRKG